MSELPTITTKDQRTTTVSFNPLVDVDEEPRPPEITNYYDILNVLRSKRRLTMSRSTNYRPIKRIVSKSIEYQPVVGPQNTERGFMSRRGVPRANLPRKRRRIRHKINHVEHASDSKIKYPAHEEPISKTVNSVKQSTLEPITHPKIIPMSPRVRIPIIIPKKTSKPLPIMPKLKPSKNMNKPNPFGSVPRVKKKKPISKKTDPILTSVRIPTDSKSDSESNSDSIQSFSMDDDFNSTEAMGPSRFEENKEFIDSDEFEDIDFSSGRQTSSDDDVYVPKNLSIYQGKANIDNFVISDDIIIEEDESKDDPLDLIESIDEMESNEFHRRGKRKLIKRTNKNGRKRETSEMDEKLFTPKKHKRPPVIMSDDESSVTFLPEKNHDLSPGKINRSSLDTSQRDIRVISTQLGFNDAIENIQKKKVRPNAVKKVTPFLPGKKVRTLHSKEPPLKASSGALSSRNDLNDNILSVKPTENPQEDDDSIDSLFIDSDKNISEDDESKITEKSDQMLVTSAPELETPVIEIIGKKGADTTEELPQNTVTEAGPYNESEITHETALSEKTERVKNVNVPLASNNKHYDENNEEKASTLDHINHKENNDTLQTVGNSDIIEEGTSTMAAKAKIPTRLQVPYVKITASVPENTPNIHEHSLKQRNADSEVPALSPLLIPQNPRNFTTGSPKDTAHHHDTNNAPETKQTLPVSTQVQKNLPPTSPNFNGSIPKLISILKKGNSGTKKFVRFKDFLEPSNLSSERSHVFSNLVTNEKPLKPISFRDYFIKKSLPKAPKAQALEGVNHTESSSLLLGAKKMKELASIEKPPASIEKQSGSGISRSTPLPWLGNIKKPGKKLAFPSNIKKRSSTQKPANIKKLSVPLTDSVNGIASDGGSSSTTDTIKNTSSVPTSITTEKSPPNTYSEKSIPLSSINTTSPNKVSSPTQANSTPLISNSSPIKPKATSQIKPLEKKNKVTKTYTLSSPTPSLKSQVPNLHNKQPSLGSLDIRSSLLFYNTKTPVKKSIIAAPNTGLNTSSNRIPSNNSTSEPVFVPESDDEDKSTQSSKHNTLAKNGKSQIKTPPKSSISKTPTNHLSVPGKLPFTSPPKDILTFVSAASTNRKNITNPQFTTPSTSHPIVEVEIPSSENESEDSSDDGIELIDEQEFLKDLSI